MIDVKVEDSGLNIDVTIEGSGPPGKAGADGISPTVDIVETENGHTVTITDKNGKESFEVTNGRDGIDGADGKSPYIGENGHWFEWQDGEYVDTGKVAEGQNGNDGISPTVEVTQTGTGHKVVITDKDGEKSFDVNNGQNGEDGVSPTIAVEDVDGGHKVTITTATGSQSFTILNGKDGDPGRPGNDGDPGEDGLTPNISIGTVETLPAGSKATAEITGETPNLVLNMGIPEGQKGDSGSGGSASGELLQTISGDDYGAINYAFPDNYDTFWVIGTLDVASDSSTIVFYQYVKTIDGNSDLKFWDYYGKAGKRLSISLCYDRVKLAQSSLLRLSGMIVDGDYIPGSKITSVESAWGDKNNAGKLLERFSNLRISGTFASVDLKIYGR